MNNHYFADFIFPLNSPITTNHNHHNNNGIERERARGSESERGEGDKEYRNTAIRAGRAVVGNSYDVVAAVRSNRMLSRIDRSIDRLPVRTTLVHVEYKIDMQ